MNIRYVSQDGRLPETLALTTVPLTHFILHQMYGNRPLNGGWFEEKVCGLKIECADRGYIGLDAVL